MREATSGVVIGKVINVEDEEGLGRIKVSFPWLNKDSESRWASIASIMAGPERGAFFVPEIDDEVLVAFEQGDWDHPYVIGFLWNQVQKPPTHKIYERVIRSVNGHAIRFVDSPSTAGDKGSLVVEDGHGNVVEMTNGKTTVRSVAKLVVEDGYGNVVEMLEAGMTIRSIAMLNIQASAVSINGVVTINGRAVAPGSNPI